MKYGTLCFVLCLSIIQLKSLAKLPYFTKAVDTIDISITIDKRCEVNSDMHVIFLLFWKENERPVSRPYGTVTIAASGGEKGAKLPSISFDLRESHFKSEDAIILKLPNLPGTYSYIATVVVPDPLDPNKKWTISSRSHVISVFKVLENFTCKVGPEGGVISSAIYADAARLIIPPGAFSDIATISIDVLSDMPSIRKTPQVSPFGKTIYISVIGAKWNPEILAHAQIHIKPPTFQNMIKGGYMFTHTSAWINFDAYKTEQNTYDVKLTQNICTFPLPQTNDLTVWYAYIGFTLFDMRNDKNKNKLMSD